MDQEPVCKSPFASASVARHLLRGTLGMVAIIAAIRVAPESAAASLILAALALLALRGCPSCWMLGLIETISARRRKQADEIRPDQPL